MIQRLFATCGLTCGGGYCALLHLLVLIVPRAWKVYVQCNRGWAVLSCSHGWHPYMRYKHQVTSQSPEAPSGHDPG